MPARVSPTYLTVVHNDRNDPRRGSLHNIAAQLFKESAAGPLFVTFTDQYSVRFTETLNSCVDAKDFFKHKDLFEIFFRIFQPSIRVLLIVVFPS